MYNHCEESVCYFYVYIYFGECLVLRLVIRLKNTALKLHGLFALCAWVFTEQCRLHTAVVTVTSLLNSFVLLFTKWHYKKVFDLTHNNLSCNFWHKLCMMLRSLKWPEKQSNVFHFHINGPRSNLNEMSKCIYKNKIWKPYTKVKGPIVTYSSLCVVNTSNILHTACLVTHSTHFCN
jgi:hypothetical protein